MPSNIFTYSPTTGTGNTIISVSANTQNTGTADNLAAITISNTASSATVELKQLYRPTFDQLASTTFPTTGGDIYFTIHSEYDVVFRSVPSWITISYNGRQYGEGERISSGIVDNKTFTLTAEANTGQSRTVNNTMNMGHYIGDDLQNYYTYFSFHQNGAIAQPSITLSPTYIEVSSAATGAGVTMSVQNCTFDHMTTSSAGSFTITASGPINNNIVLTFPASTTSAETRGYLSFYLYDTNGSAYTSTITVVRAGKTQTKDMLLSPTGATVTSAGSSYTIYVVTTACTFMGMTYTGSNADFPVTAFKDGNYIRLTYSANTGASRTTQISFTLRDEENNPYYKTFALTQNGPVTTDDVQIPVSVDFHATTNRNFTVTLNFESLVEEPFGHVITFTGGTGAWAGTFNATISLVSAETPLHLTVNVGKERFDDLSYNNNISMDYGTDSLYETGPIATDYVFNTIYQPGQTIDIGIDVYDI